MVLGCHACGTPIDPLRQVARIVGSKVVSLCAGCARASSGQATATVVALPGSPAARIVVCSDCGVGIEAWRARPFVSTTAVKLRCAVCATGGYALYKVEETDPGIVASQAVPRPEAPRPARSSWKRASIAGAALIAVAALGGQLRASRPETLRAAAAVSAPRPAAVAHVERPRPLPDKPAAPVSPHAATHLGAALAAAAVDPLPVVTEANDRARARRPGDALGAGAAALVARPVSPRAFAGAFIFPLSGGDRGGADTPEGRFGAPRAGRSNECGEGHCGVDLLALEGTIVLAARDGEVAQIWTDPHNLGGVWIRLAHEGGMSTWYMHLDAVRPELKVGDPVRAGEEIATLGRTGVKDSPTHLHFAITVENAGGRQVHVDPTPWLALARTVE